MYLWAFNLKRKRNFVLMDSHIFDTNFHRLLNLYLKQNLNRIQWNLGNISRFMSTASNESIRLVLARFGQWRRCSGNLSKKHVTDKWFSWRGQKRAHWLNRRERVVGREKSDKLIFLSFRCHLHRFHRGNALRNRSDGSREWQACFVREAFVD